MGREQRARDFCRSMAFFDDQACICVVKEMERSGRLLVQTPLWLLLALAAVVCWLLYAASSVQLNPSPTFTPMLILPSILLPSAVASARRWVYRVYYRCPIIIGARAPTA